MYGSDELRAKVRSELEQVNFAAAGSRSGRRERGREGGELDSRLVCSADRLDAARKRTIGALTTMHESAKGRVALTHKRAPGRMPIRRTDQPWFRPFATDRHSTGRTFVC